MKDSPLIFIHIPKTAGTSFRLALANAFDEERIMYDYGMLSDHTSAITKEYLGSKPSDVFELCKAASSVPVELVIGHIGLHAYLMLTSIDKVVSFLRNPLEQVVSHWRHHVKYHDYDCSLEDFCSESRFTNIQSRFLANAPIEMIGHLLITERYAESLALFNSDYDTVLEVMAANQNSEKTDNTYEISNPQRALIRKKNQKDIRLYKHAVSLFERRVEVMKNGQDWVYGVCYPVDNNGFVKGWAYQQNDRPVDLELLLNGKVVAETKSVIYRSNLNTFRAPRRSCIGFQFKVKKPVGRHKLSCRVKSTGQELFPPIRS